MKARNFRYVRPASLDDAYRIFEGEEDAVPVAGGQSLLAGLNMRLSAPRLLVDIGDLHELTGLSADGDAIRVGALTKHAELLRSDLVRTRLPLLTEAVAHVGHVAIRNRGTIGGSLAYADPAAELPACSVALDATLVLGGRNGTREVKAEDFFVGLFDTDLRPGELIVAVRFPVPPAGTTVGFAELARRHGDFALVGLAAVARCARDRIETARLVYFGCVDRAKVAPTVSAAAAGLALPLADEGALDAAVGADLAPDDTPGLRADTKLRMARVLTRRVLNTMTEARAAA